MPGGAPATGAQLGHAARSARMAACYDNLSSWQVRKITWGCRRVTGAAPGRARPGGGRAPRPKLARTWRWLLASPAPQLERAWDAWQAERYQRGEISQRPGYADNPFRPR
jgi:hypothetical protein